MKPWECPKCKRINKFNQIRCENLRCSYYKSFFNWLFSTSSFFVKTIAIIAVGFIAMGTLLIITR